MPTKRVLQRAQRDKRQGKSASVPAGEFVKDEIERIRQGEHGARSTKQAIAIGLSKARRAGVDLKPPRKSRGSSKTRRKAERDAEAGREHPNAKPDPKLSRAATKALKREGRAAASHQALSRQAKNQARKKTKAERSAIGKKAARTRARNAAK